MYHDIVVLQTHEADMHVHTVAKVIEPINMSDVLEHDICTSGTLRCMRVHTCLTHSDSCSPLYLVEATLMVDRSGRWFCWRLGMFNCDDVSRLTTALPDLQLKLIDERLRIVLASCDLMSRHVKIYT